MNTPLLEAYLKALKLPAVLANYQRIAQSVDDPVAYLAGVLSVEMERRHENGIKQRIAAARFPTMKTFDSFDFAAQPGLPKMKILELAESRFVDDCRTAVLYGPPGTGKTHCLLAIGFSACTNGHRTLFVTAAGLLNELLDAKRDGGLARKLRSIDRFDLLLAMPFFRGDPGAQVRWAIQHGRKVIPTNLYESRLRAMDASLPRCHDGLGGHRPAHSLWLGLRVHRHQSPLTQPRGGSRPKAAEPNPLQGFNFRERRVHFFASVTSAGILHAGICAEGRPVMGVPTTIS